jgi:hypothetical protein
MSTNFTGHVVFAKLTGNYRVLLIHTETKLTEFLGAGTLFLLRSFSVPRTDDDVDGFINMIMKFDKRAIKLPPSQADAKDVASLLDDLTVFMRKTNAF